MDYMTQVDSAKTTIEQAMSDAKALADILPDGRGKLSALMLVSKLVSAFTILNFHRPVVPCRLDFVAADASNPAQDAGESWTMLAAETLTNFLMPDDLVALKRFAECCEDSDSGGHDVQKDQMTRLREIGVVESKGFGKHQITAFGGYVLDLANDESPVLPLKTLEDYNEASRLAHNKKLSAS